MEAIGRKNKALDSAASTAANSSAASRHHRRITRNAGAQQNRHSRVWKACVRCRMKKTKCDGDYPCQRCKDNGLVCIAAVRKKTGYKRIPSGYAEILENTQLTLIATLHKLYSMVRAGQAWELGQPSINARGLPAVHDIADRLGCIRPNSDIDLPAHSVFPEDELSLAELCSQLEEQGETDSPAVLHDNNDARDGCSERLSWSEGDYSTSEPDYYQLPFDPDNEYNSGTGNGNDASQVKAPLGAGEEFLFLPRPLSSSNVAAGAHMSQLSMLPGNINTTGQASPLALSQVDRSQLDPSYQVTGGTAEADFGELADFDFIVEFNPLELASSETVLGLGGTSQF